MMPPEGLESQNIVDTNRQNKLLYQLIEEDFHMPRNKFKNSKNGRNWLAEMNKAEKIREVIQKGGTAADVKDEEYKGNEIQNIRIRNRILRGGEGDILDYGVGNYDENMNNLNTSHAEYIKKHYSEDQINMYMKGISATDLQNLNALSPIAFMGFWDGEMQGIEKRKQYIEARGGSLSTMTIENMANIGQLMDMQERLHSFITKNGLTEFARDNVTGTFASPEREKDFKAFFEQQKKLDTYEVLKGKHGGDQGAEEWLRQAYMFQNIDTKNLNDTAKMEFAKMTMDFCEHAAKIGIDLAKFGLNMLYQNAVTLMSEAYQTSNAYTQIYAKVMSDTDVNVFFEREENRVEKLVDDDKKSVEYYKNLIKLYPELDILLDNGQTISTLFTEEYFTLTPRMQPKDSASEDVKNVWETFVKNSSGEKGKEKDLENKTNAVVQTVAIQQCLAALQKVIDIDVDDKENLLDQLMIQDGLDAITLNGNDMLLNIKGNMKTDPNRKISLSYNVSKGEVYYQKYMQKSGTAGADTPITIGSNTMTETPVPFITLPTLGSVIDKSKSMTQNGTYMELMESSENTTAYQENVKDELMKEYAISETIGFEVGRDMIKKNILQDMIIQDLAKITGKENTITKDAITQNSHPDSYKLYNSLYKSFEYYSMKPLYMLTMLHENIVSLAKTKEEARNYSQEQLMEYTTYGKNQERSFVHNCVHPTKIPDGDIALKDQGPEASIRTFFEVFKIDKGGPSVLDVQMMKDYFTTTTKNTDEAKLGTWGQNRENTTFKSSCDIVYSSVDADTMLKNGYGEESTVLAT